MQALTYDDAEFFYGSWDAAWLDLTLDKGDNMASSRPSGFKKGGGFLNNVAGEIADYEFTPNFPGGDGKKAKQAKGNDGEPFNPLYFILRVDVDGAEKQAETTLLAGSADDFEIEDDGKTLNPVDDAVGLRANTPFGRFLGSLIDADFEESRLPDDGEPLNYEAIIGTRAQFVQVPDDDAMAKQAKKWRQSNGKYNEKGQKKGKDGKYYNLQYLTVSEVLALPGDKPATKKTAKPAVGKTTGKAAKAAKEPDAETLAVETLLAILADNDGEISRQKLPAAIAGKLGLKHPQREEVRKLVYGEDFLAKEDGWTYDTKKKVVNAA